VGSRVEALVKRSGGEACLKLKDDHFIDALRRAKFGLLARISG